MTARPAFSVVIPTLDEAASVAATIDAAQHALGPEAEILVADGGSTDATVAIADRAGARVLHAGRGRGTQLRAGVDAARGATVVLLHADTRLPAGARAAIDAALADVAVAGGAFRLAFDTDGAERVPTALRVYAGWLNTRSRWFGMITGDQAMFVRADALRAVGGVPALPLFEDVRLNRALARHGTLRLLGCAVSTSPRRFLRHGTLRTIALHLGFRALHAAGVAPERLARWYPAAAGADG
jgi:rSAM/selenodomain-associated transferase 2